MTPIRTALALGALTAAAAVFGAHPARAQIGRRVAAPPVTPAANARVTPSPIVNLLTLGAPPAATTITPAAAGPRIGRGPSSQPIPGPVLD